MKCYDYNPNAFKKMKGKDWDRWSSTYKIYGAAVPFIDRTGTIKMPVDTGVPDHLKMPAYDNNFSLSYKDCCSKRVQELVSLQDKHNLPIRLMYSGGIDSSLILASFIDTLGVSESAKRLEVVLSQESIYENPWMWDKFIRPHFTILNSENYKNLINNEAIISAGEGNDQLLGAEIFKSLVDWGGDGVLNKKHSADLIIDFLKFRNLTNEEAEVWYSLLFNLISKAECSIETIGDWWWWVNFTCKWSNVYYRMLRTLPENFVIDQNFTNIHYQQFFCTDYFQQWSMKDTSQKHQGNFMTYKYHAKELVADVMNSPEYLGKLKRGSLYEIFKVNKTSNVIDSNSKVHYEINPSDWYNPINSFNY
jgi:hypothetical protein